MVAYILPIAIILSITSFIARKIQNSKRRKAMIRLKALIIQTRVDHAQVSSALKQDEKTSLVSKPTRTDISTTAEEEKQSNSKQPNQNQPTSKTNIRNILNFPVITLSPFAKLYIILGSFCTLWLPFCILWPVKSVSPGLIDPIVYTASYWMGYAQSFINPILLMILNQNYRI